MFHAKAIDRSWRIVTRLGLLITMPLVVAATPVTLHVPEYPGANTDRDREGTNEVLAVTHAFRTSLDPASGLPDRGAPQHSPVVITKLVDQSTTGFYQALATGQTLDVVTINFYQPQQDGTEAVFFTIELDRARIVSIEVEQDSEKYPESTEIRERVGFVYETITWTFHETNDSTTASWILSP